MRKPRDFDAELKALEAKARALKERKVQQLGELVIATGADALDAETLAGALLKTMETNDAIKREAWRKRGAGWDLASRRKAFVYHVSGKSHCGLMQYPALPICST